MRRAILIVIAALAAALPAAAGPVATGSAAAPRPPAAPVTTGLVLSYGFDNDTGTTARDSGPNRIDAAYINTTAAAAKSASVAGKGSAIRLVGAQEQFVSVPERNALDVDRYTLAALVNYTGVQNPKTFERWEVFEKAGAYWINIRTNGRVRVGGFFGGCTNPAWHYLDSTVAIPTNTWTHVASTYNGSTVTVWINGVKRGSMAVSGRTCSNNRPLAIGAKNYPEGGFLEAFYDGQIDDVRIYKQALTATQIKTLLPG